MSSKLHRLASNLNDLIPKEGDSYTLWRNVLNVRKKYQDYFKGKDANFVLTIFLMIISLRKTGNFDYYEKIRDQVFFFGIFITTGDYHVANCEECSGNGYESCDTCYGDGSEECDECDGSGHEECDECGGDGTIVDENGQEIECEECNGSGEKDCDNCEGHGNTTCDSCDGQGQIDCNNCDGKGEIESDTEKDFNTFLYVSWNPTMKTIAELRVGTFQGIDEENFEKLIQKDTVLLGTDDFHGEPDDSVEDVLDDVNYIYYFDDDLSNVHFSQSGLQLATKAGDLSTYFKYWDWV